MVDFSALIALRIREVFTRTEPTPTAPDARSMTDRPSWGMTLAREGEILYRAGDRSYLSDRRHLLIYPRGASYVYGITEPGSFSVVNFDIAGDAPLCDGFVSVPISSPERFFALFDILAHHASTDRTLRRAEIFSSFYALVAFVEGEYASSGSLPYVRRALQYFEEHLTDPSLTVKETAEALGISEIYLRKLFDEGTGSSPLRHLTAARMEKARMLLSTGDLPVGEVASLCGYGSIYHFSRAFKHENLCTPTDYRLMKRQW